MLSDDEEVLDLVDSDDQVVGQITHTAAYQPGNLAGNFLRATSCFVMNKQGQIWIPRRLTTKTIAPGGLDFSAGGHVATGESYSHAMLRELAEETGLQAAESELELIIRQTPAMAAPHYYFQTTYLYRTDAVPVGTPADFSGFEWLEPLELRTRLLSGEIAKSNLLSALEALLAYLG